MLFNADFALFSSAFFNFVVPVLPLLGAGFVLSSAGFAQMQEREKFEILKKSFPSCPLKHAKIRASLGLT